jgi:hypothetical protein
MKRIISGILLLAALLAGCVSASLDNYHYATFADIQAKRRANATNQAEIYNRWYYAGSDDKYDYIYEYTKGISITPPSNFHYYKLDRGQLENLPARFPFKPDLKANPELFTW